MEGLFYIVVFAGLVTLNHLVQEFESADVFLTHLWIMVLGWIVGTVIYEVVTKASRR